MLMPSIFGEDLFDDFMGYPTGRQAAANAYPQVKDDKGKYVRRERYTGTCNRSFYVGSSIKHEDIHAKYENGILHVTFPKEETKKEAEEKKFVSID